LDTSTPFATLAAKDEKNRKGSTIPLRPDLVAELREWIADKRENFSGTAAEFDAQPLFSVPKGLMNVLNRDLRVAGIPKVDERGRSLDVHAMRMTFATMLSKGGVSPKLAQLAMRHSDIRLTMEIYTDPKLLDVPGAIKSLPALNPARESGSRKEKTEDADGWLVPPLVATVVQRGLSESLPVILTADFGSKASDIDERENPTKPTKKGLSEGNSDKPSESGRQDLNLRPLHPQCSECNCRITVNRCLSVRCRTRGFSTRYTDRHELHIE